MSLTVRVQDIVDQEIDPLLAIDPSWARVPLGAIAQILNGFAFPSKNFRKEGGTPLIRIRDVSADRTVCTYAGDFDPRYAISPGDLLVGMDGDFKCAAWKGPMALLNQRVCKIAVTRADYSERFLALALPGYLNAIRRHTSSVTVSHLSSRDIAEIPLPFPPLAEQKRIVAKVEGLLASVNAARERLARVPAILKRFRQAALEAACQGKLTEDWRDTQQPGLSAAILLSEIGAARQEVESESGRRHRQPTLPDADTLPCLSPGWVAATVSQLAWLDQGFAFKSSEFVERGIRLLRGENVAPGALRWDDIRYWPTDRAPEFEKLVVEAGEIILALDRPIVSAGLKLAQTKPEDVPCLLVQRVMRFRPVEPSLSAFLYLCLQTDRFQHHLAGGMTGSDLPHVTGTTVADFTVPLPALLEQREIVRRVRTLLRLADTVENRVADASACAERLTQAILAKAFHGELVSLEVVQTS